MIEDPFRPGALPPLGPGRLGVGTSCDRDGAGGPAEGGVRVAEPVEIAQVRVAVRSEPADVGISATTRTYATGFRDVRATCGGKRCAGGRLFISGAGVAAGQARAQPSGRDRRPRSTMPLR